LLALEVLGRNLVLLEPQRIMLEAAAAEVEAAQQVDWVELAAAVMVH